MSQPNLFYLLFLHRYSRVLYSASTFGIVIHAYSWVNSSKTHSTHKQFRSTHFVYRCRYKKPTMLCKKFCSGRVIYNYNVKTIICRLDTMHNSFRHHSLRVRSHLVRFDGTKLNRYLKIIVNRFIDTLQS